MPIRFFNIHSGEELIAENEPQIAALWGSSDRGPNANGGQDFGWRFAPEVVVELREIMNDPTKVQEIANRFRISYEDVTEPIVMTWISDKTELMNAPVATTGDYEEDYQNQIRALEAQKKKQADKTAPTNESLEDLQKRVELQERLAAAEAKTTTSTTTKK